MAEAGEKIQDVIYVNGQGVSGPCFMCLTPIPAEIES